MDVGQSADIVELGLGTKEYEADVRHDGLLLICVEI